MDDSTRPAVRDGLQAEQTALLAWVEQVPGLDLGAPERQGRDRLDDLGAQVLTAGLRPRRTCRLPA